MSVAIVGLCAATVALRPSVARAQGCGPGISARIFTPDECCSKRLIPCAARPDHPDACCEGGTITTELEIHCLDQFNQCLEFWGDGPFDTCVPDISDDAEELPNGLDDNCDGVGIGDEFCDGIDNDGDGRVDEDLGSCVHRFLFVPVCWAGTEQSEATAAVDRWMQFFEEKSLINGCGYTTDRGRKFWVDTLPVQAVGCPGVNLPLLLDATRDTELVDLRDYDTVSFITNQSDDNPCQAGFTPGGGLVGLDTGGETAGFNGEYVTFAHEFGHLMGLGEEYRADDNTFNDLEAAYGCDPSTCCTNPHACAALDGSLCLGNFATNTTGWSWQRENGALFLAGPNGETWGGEPTGFPPFHADQSRCIMANASAPGWDNATNPQTGEGSHRGWCPLCLGRYGNAGPKCVDTFDGDVRRLEANGNIDDNGNVFVTYSNVEDGRIGMAPQQTGETIIEIRDQLGELILTFAPDFYHSEPSNPSSGPLPFWIRTPVADDVDGPIQFTSFRDGELISTVTAGGLPPTAQADSVLSECNAHGGSSVVLDGSASFDPDGDTLYFTWDAPGVVLVGADTATPSGFFPLGPHTVTLTVADGTGAADSITIQVLVEDTIAPVFDAVSLTPACLWPPNHRMVRYDLDQELSAAVTDVCDPEPFVELTFVESDEAASGADDFLFGASAVCLRSEREGGGDGRTYSLELTATDASDNSSVGAGVVRVPHDSADAGTCASLPGSGDFIGKKDENAACAFQ